MAKPLVVYLDIETFGPHHSPRVLSVGLLHERLGERLTGTQVIFRAYPSDESELPFKERRMLEKFYSYYDRLLSGEDGIVFLVGWNITNFDLPLLYHRLHGIGVDREDLFHLLFYRPHIVDLRQIYVFLKGFYLTGTSQSAVMRDLFGLERVSGGDEVAGLYREGCWDELDAHLVEDLAFNRALFHAYRSAVREDVGGILDSVRLVAANLKKSIERLRSIYGGG